MAGGTTQKRGYTIFYVSKGPGQDLTKIWVVLAGVMKL